MEQFRSCAMFAWCESPAVASGNDIPITWLRLR